MFWMLFIVTCATAAWLLRRLRRFLVIMLIAGASSVLLPASAQHALDWYSVDNGGGRSTHAAGLAVQGTIGQPDARSLAAGSMVLAGGLWGGGPPDTLLADGFESPPGSRVRMEESDEMRNE